MANAAAADLVLDTALVKKYDGFGPRYTSYPTADRFHAGVTRRAVRATRCATRNHERAAAAAVAVRAHPVLQHHLLLLRVQQGDHQGPRALGQVHPLRRPRDRHRRRPDRGRRRRSSSCTGAAARRRSSSRDEMTALMGMLRGALRVRAGRRGLDRGRSAQGRRRHHRLPGRARLQPHLGRHPGLRSRGAGGGQPHPDRGRDDDGDRRGARQRLRLGQRRPDLRAAAADGGRLLGDARQGDRGVARPHRALQLRARAAPVQAAAPHRHRRRCRRRRPSSRSSRSRSRSSARAGYVYIGMDHFAKPTDELAVAQAQRKLHRNFQGYSTKPDCDMLAFGISAIGKVGAVLRRRT